ALFDSVPDHHRNIGPAEALDLANAGGRGDVDLGEVIANHVDADKDHVAFFERRGDGGADFQFTRGQRAQLRTAADMHVGPRLAIGRNAVETGNRLAIDDDDPLVALAHVGQVFLDHEGFAIILLEQFQEADQIVVALLDEEYPGPAIAVERLDDDVAMLLA